MSWGMRQIENNFKKSNEYQKKLDDFRKRQSADLEERTKHIPPIVDMRDAVKQVRKNKSTLADPLINATTTKTYK